MERVETTVRPGPDNQAAAHFLGEDAPQRLAAPTLLGHWFAYQDDNAIGLAYAFRRADSRIFVVHRGDEDAAFEPLLSAVCRSTDEALNLTIGSDAAERHAAARAHGFGVELEAQAFDVPFDSAVNALRPMRRSVGCQVVTADQVRLDDLYRLDIALRNDVPGTDGWRGRRDAFDDEMNAPEYDPSGYAVAKSPDGALVGLCRLWRNETQPRLGLIGVLPRYRNGLVAASLLVNALTGAATWGSETFDTHTARPALQRRLLSIGATQTGGFTRLRRG